MSTLPEMYRERAAMNIAKWQAAQDLERRKLDLTPVEGWPGKNEDARTLARDKALAADESVKALSQTVAELETRLGLLAGEIESAEAERRAEEWHIRAKLIDALEHRNVQPNGNGDRAETAFDDTVLDRTTSIFANELWTRSGRGLSVTDLNEYRRELSAAIVHTTDESDLIEFKQMLDSATLNKVADAEIPF